MQSENQDIGSQQDNQVQEPKILSNQMKIEEHYDDIDQQINYNPQVHNQAIVGGLGLNKVKNESFNKMNNAQRAEIKDQKRAQMQSENQVRVKQEQNIDKNAQNAQLADQKRAQIQSSSGSRSNVIQQQQLIKQQKPIQQQQFPIQQQQMIQQAIKKESKKPQPPKNQGPPRMPPPQCAEPSFFGSIQNFFGNLFGGDLHKAEYQYHPVAQDRFNDDDDIQFQNQDAKQQQINIEELVDIKVQAQYDYSKLKKNESQNLPAMVSIITKDIDQYAKSNNSIEAGIDLICVIDKSGSMQGEKIRSVQQSLIRLLEFLSEKDRLCLITFDSSARRHTCLRATTAENKKYFVNAISAINAGGGTNIASGTQIAFNQIQQRKNKNQVTSIFLLSDGQDTGAALRIETQKKQISDVVTIHSFGYGNDHDAQLMSSICKAGQGSFYFIQNVKLLDEFFADALGRLASAVAENIQLDIKCTPPQPYENIQIIKTYGEMWNELDKGRLYQIKQPQIASDSRKDFVFEFALPPYDQQILDEQRAPVLVQVFAQFTNTFTKQFYQKVAQFQLKLYNEDEQIGENDPNEDVTKEYLRVKATEAIEQAKQKCEQSKNEEAEEFLEKMKQNILTDQKLAKVSAQAVLDIDQAKNASKRKNFQVFGSKQMCQLASNNYQQEGLNAQFDLGGQQMQQMDQAVFQNKKQVKMMKQVQSYK